MRNAIHFAIGLALFGAVLPTQVAAQEKAKKLYCWDDHGRKVCGDALPASAAGAGRTEISAKSGRTLDTVARAQTDEERATAEQQAQQAQQAADLQMQQQRRDLAMVESYSTEDDLRRAYRDRTDLLDASIKTSRLSIDNLHQSLLSLLAHAADDELANKPVAQPQLAGMQNAHAELLKQQRILAQQKADRTELDAELADAVQRYRALKSAQAGNAEAPAAPAPTP